MFDSVVRDRLLHASVGQMTDIPLLGIINAFNDFDAFIICPGQKRIEALLVFVQNRRYSS